MPPNLYNPCPDGLPAKVWECLRRNKPFRRRAARIEMLRAESKTPKSARALKQEVRLYQNRHLFAQVAFGHLFPLDETAETILPAEFNVEAPWPNTSAAFRRDFSNIFSRMASMPKQIPSPPKELIGRLSSKDSRNEFVAWMFEVAPLFSNRTALSIPVYILDPQHRRTVLAEIEKAIPKPIFSAGPETQRGSGFLGTNADWDTWLLIADLQERAGLSLLKAEFQGKSPVGCLGRAS